MQSMWMCSIKNEASISSTCWTRFLRSSRRCMVKTWGLTQIFRSDQNCEKKIVSVLPEKLRKKEDIELIKDWANMTSWQKKFEISTLCTFNCTVHLSWTHVLEMSIPYLGSPLKDIFCCCFLHRSPIGHSQVPHSLGKKISWVEFPILYVSFFLPSATTTKSSFCFYSLASQRF